jgi:hypothetical protein
MAAVDTGNRIFFLRSGSDVFENVKKDEQKSQMRNQIEIRLHFLDMLSICKAELERTFYQLKHQNTSYAAHFYNTSERTNDYLASGRPKEFKLRNNYT